MDLDGANDCWYKAATLGGGGVLANLRGWMGGRFSFPTGDDDKEDDSPLPPPPAAGGGVRIIITVDDEVIDDDDTKRLRGEEQTSYLGVQTRAGV